jgi:uncharacterized DUF497 family protein
MRFEWDEEKDRINRRKHGVDFETAAHVFGDLNYILQKDIIDEEGEQRWHADDLPLLVVHVYRSTQDGEEITRIISARRASERESRGYFGQTFD